MIPGNGNGFLERECKCRAMRLWKGLLRDISQAIILVVCAPQVSKKNGLRYEIRLRGYALSSVLHGNACCYV